MLAKPLPPAKIKEMQIEEQKERDAKSLAEKKDAPKPTGRFHIANPDEMIKQLSIAEKEDEAFQNYKPGYRNIQDVAETNHAEWNLAQDVFEDLTAFRDSLVPPEKCHLSTAKFFDIEKCDEYLHVGRPMVLDQHPKAFSATLWIYKGSNAASPNSIQSKDFPLKISSIKPILDLLGMGTNQHMRSIKEFLEIQLPEGFPLQIQIPIGMFPLSAVFRFENIVSECTAPDSFFDIPQDYTEGEVLAPSSDMNV